jgi:hypothetical protein
MVTGEHGTENLGFRTGRRNLLISWRIEKLSRSVLYKDTKRVHKSGIQQPETRMKRKSSQVVLCQTIAQYAS